MSAVTTIREYDPYSPEFQADPFSVYRWMLEEAPVFHSERWGWYALSRWEDVRAAALDHETFLSFEGIDIDATATDQSGPGFLPDIDNPRHDQLRRVVQPWFLPRRIAKHQEHVRDVARAFVDGWADRDEIDLGQELSWPMPMEIFFDLIGLPSADEDAEGRVNLERWVHELKDRKPGDDRLTPVAVAATQGIREYFVALLNERRANPRDDLITHIVMADVDGTPLADDEITEVSEVMGLMTILLFGSAETTSGLMSTLFKVLGENPDQLQLLLDDPSLIPDAVEEAVRYATPLQLVARTTSRDVTMHGVTIPQGARVVLVYGAANRDPRQFEDPDRFLVTRGTFRHLGFGEGLHGCLGRPLATLDITVAAQELLPVLGRYELSREPVRYNSTPNAYVWENIFVRPQGRTPQQTDRPEAAVAHDAASVDDVSSATETAVRVVRKQAVSDGVISLELEAADGGRLPPWRPGAHVDLLIEGVAARQYSLCGDPGQTRSYRLGILRDENGRGSSVHVHDRLAEGDELRIRGPRNHFRLVDAERYLFIAGGIGITPIMAMAAEAERGGVPWSLVYGGRTRRSMAFVDELARFGEKVQLRPEDEVGRLDLASILRSPTEGTLVYCCGPEPLLDAVESACANWPAGSLRLERFAPKDQAAPVLDEPFELVLARSDLTLEVPTDRSILDVLGDQGIVVMSSCGEGTCGTCEVAVVDGVPDHRDSVLDEDERSANDCLMVCVSRSCSKRLVLDL